MVSSFWQKGFYFNGSLFFFHSIQFTSLKAFFGIGSYFVSLLLLRFDWFIVNNFFLKKKNTLLDTINTSGRLKKNPVNGCDDEVVSQYTPISLPPLTANYFYKLPYAQDIADSLLGEHRDVVITDLTAAKYQTLTFTFNNFLVITYPVFLNIKSQQKFNIFFYYMVRSARGISLKLGKPISRKTRGRTYLNLYWTKPKKAYQMYNTTRRWF